MKGMTERSFRPPLAPPNLGGEINTFEPPCFLLSQEGVPGGWGGCGLPVSLAFPRLSETLLMHALDGSPTGVVHVAEGGIPFEGDSGAASHAGLGGNAAGG